MTTSQLLDPAQIAPGCSGRDVESDPSPSSSSCTIAFSAEVSPCRRPQVYRSKRRRASEDLLHRLHAAPPQQPPPAKRHRPMQSWVQVAKCGDACPCQICTGAGALSVRGWCAQDIAIPHIDWGIAVAELRAITLKDARLPCGLRVLIVDEAFEVETAINALRDSMVDRVLTIDLEWRPDHITGLSSDVALLQLASSTVCVLFRTCLLRPRLPPLLEALLREEGVTLLGYSWDQADEAKMLSTFGLGRAVFASFLDLQEVASALGYRGGLNWLTQQVLGVDIPKSKRVTLSDWQAACLSHEQLAYAALDVLTAGHVFRALRLWHAHPSPCGACYTKFGAPLFLPPITCSFRGCGKKLSSLQSLATHMASVKHQSTCRECEACGRCLPKPC